MDTFNVMNRWFTHNATVGTLCSRTFALLSLGLVLLPLSASCGEKPTNKSGEVWPISVEARYRLRYDNMDVGRLNVTSSTTPNTYTVSTSGKVSLLFGMLGWSGASNVSGTFENGAPAPATYAFNLQHKKKKKNVAIHIAYKDHVPAEVTVDPAPHIRPDTVPLTQEHKVGTLDPLSAILVLTKADKPCDRRIAVFDGTQRYDIVITPKRRTQLPPSGNAPAETAYVCRLTYEPVAGHRANADTQAYASNRNVELVLRRIPGSEMLIPYSLTIPTEWGTGAMVTERMDIVTTTGKTAFSN
jgi:hypothetical protein